jgi:hydrogenase expression/formation protein HypE
MTCPSSVGDKATIHLAHGEGGRAMRRLLAERILPILGTSGSEDAASIGLANGEWAVTADSFVVSPLFFPGGDIGSLAVYGTVNDLAVAGAEPKFLTLNLILEEGLAIETLDRILSSIAAAALKCGVSIVAGDTKVVPAGAVDKIFIATTGIGIYLSKQRPASWHISEGDCLIVSGPIGKHGIAVLAARENLRLKPEPMSDSAPLHAVCAALVRELGENLHAMRDATRGGVSAVLHEWSNASGKTMMLVESQLPIAANIRGACELLGLDPLYVANEGTFVAAVAPDSVSQALHVMRQWEVSASAQCIGQVSKLDSAPVVIERLLGNRQVVDEPVGAPLPRIC